MVTKELKVGLYKATKRPTIPRTACRRRWTCTRQCRVPDHGAARSDKTL